MEIKEIIVVEGKKDTARIQKFFSVETFETGGTGISKKDISYLKLLQEKRGIIVFTDPDYPGEYIRKKISESIPEAKHAFIIAKQAREKGKVGVEHASKEVLQEALQSLLTFQEKQETFAYSDYLTMGLSGQKNSKQLRILISNHYHIGESNGKTLWKRLNALQLQKEEIAEVLSKYEQ